MDNTIANGILLFMMLDGFIYLLFRSWQLHKLNESTTALTDKLFYSTIITLAINILVYTGKLFDINTQYFNTLSYLGGVGLFVIACVLGLKAHEFFKKQKPPLI